MAAMEVKSVKWEKNICDNLDDMELRKMSLDIIIDERGDWKNYINEDDGIAVSNDNKDE